MQRLILFLAVLVPTLCSAQLTGQYVYHFTNNLPLWDFSGTYALSDGEVESEDVLTVSPRGGVTGTGSASFDDGVNSFDATQTSVGKVSASTRDGVRMSAKGAGQFTGTALGIPVSGPFKASLRLTLDPVARNVSGPVSGTVCVPSRGCRTFSTNATFALLAEMDGSWMLTLDVQTSESSVTGTAIITLSNDRTLPFNVTGSYSPATGISKLKLKGTGVTGRASLAMTVDSNGQLFTLKGKLFGQPLLFP